VPPKRGGILGFLLEFPPQGALRGGPAGIGENPPASGGKNLGSTGAQQGGAGGISLSKPHPAKARKGGVEDGARRLGGPNHRPSTQGGFFF